MTRTTNARVAGIALLLYIAVGIAALVVMSGATGGTGSAERLASIASNTGNVRLFVVLSLLADFCAVTLGVTFYALTRDEDADLARIGMACRIIEGIPGVSATLALLWLATAPDAAALDPGARHALGAYLLRDGGGPGAIFFAVASTIFAWLMLRGRLIPAWLAQLGVVASVLLVVVLPLQLAGLLGGRMGWTSAIAWLVWLPMLVFEVTLALWLIVKGVGTRRSA